MMLPVLDYCQKLLENDGGKMKGFYRKPIGRGWRKQDGNGGSWTDSASVGLRMHFWQADFEKMQKKTPLFTQKSEKWRDAEGEVILFFKQYFAPATLAGKRQILV